MEKKTTKKKRNPDSERETSNIHKERKRRKDVTSSKGLKGKGWSAEITEKANAEGESYNISIKGEYTALGERERERSS